MQDVVEELNKLGEVMAQQVVESLKISYDKTASEDRFRHYIIWNKGGEVMSRCSAVLSVHIERYA